MVRVSLNDIAKKAGVSKALVSLVVNNKSSDVGISRETRDRVLSIVTDLNYRPNQIARSLRTQRTYTIGLIVADISNPFYSNIARSVEDNAQKHGYNVIFCSSDENPEKEIKEINLLKDRGVDGIIVSTTQVNYDVEGKLQKTPLSEPSAPDKKRGLRGKVAGSKTEDMKAYMEQVKALIGEYVPPSPERMQEASAAGRVAVSSPSADAAQLMFTDYARAGDQMTLLFDAATKKIRHIDIASALENKDPVSMKVEFQALPDGTNYAAVTTVDAPAKQIQVKTEQINFQKVAR